MPAVAATTGCEGRHHQQQDAEPRPERCRRPERRPCAARWPCQKVTRCAEPNPLGEFRQSQTRWLQTGLLNVRSTRDPCPRLVGCTSGRCRLNRARELLALDAIRLEMATVLGDALAGNRADMQLVPRGDEASLMGSNGPTVPDANDRAWLDGIPTRRRWRLICKACLSICICFLFG